MGHARADVFRRHYMHQTVKVDTQSTYLGTANRADLIKTIGLMRQRDPRAPVKLDLENRRFGKNSELSTLTIKQKRLTAELKAECGTVGKAKVHQLEKYDEHIRLSREIQRIRAHLKHSALKDLRAKFFENVDHDEIGQQLRGGDASTFTYARPEFHCPTRSQISDAFSSVEAMTPNKWSETVCALSALCTQKARIHTKATEGKENLCQFCLNDDKLSPADRLHSFFSPGSLRTHINRRHSPIAASREQVNCQYLVYVPTHGEHLKNLPWAEWDGGEGGAQENGGA